MIQPFSSKRVSGLISMIVIIIAAACTPEAQTPAAGSEDVLVSQPSVAEAVLGIEWALVSYGPAENPITPLEGATITAAFGPAEWFTGGYYALMVKNGGTWVSTRSFLHLADWGLGLKVKQQRRGHRSG